MALNDALAQLSGMTLDLSFQETSNKNYQVLQSYRNTTSYSILSELHSCPRKYQLIKARAASGSSGNNNVDFAYGHAVGAGVQAWLATGDLDKAILNCVLAWNIGFFAEVEKKKKSIWNAIVAVQKYVEFSQASMEDWEVWKAPNGKDAIELSISIDFENGFKHYIHIDVILVNKLTGQLAVQENKTSGFLNIEEAIYANSNQALSYACVVDMLSDDTSFEVFYCVYSSTSREWNLLPFTKRTALKAEWITDVRLDHATIATYNDLNFYPKRGESCFTFMRRCEFFGSCNLTSNLQVPSVLPADKEAERVDYAFKLSDMIARQHSLNQTEPVNADSNATNILGGNFENIDY